MFTELDVTTHRSNATKYALRHSKSDIRPKLKGRRRSLQLLHSLTKLGSFYDLEEKKPTKTFLDDKTGMV
jgi:hypothetical protein